MLSTLRNAVRNSTQPLIRQHPPRNFTTFSPISSSQGRFFAAPAKASASSASASANAMPKQLTDAEKEARRAALKAGPGKDIFDPFIEMHGAVVLDGGLTTSLPNDAEKHHLWGNQLLFDNVEDEAGSRGLDLLYRTHYTFMDSGADVIGTMTYKVSHELVQQCDDRDMLKDADEMIAEMDKKYGFSSRVEAVNKLTEKMYERAINTAKNARDHFADENAELFYQSTDDRLLLAERLRPLVFASCGPISDNQLFVGQTSYEVTEEEAKQGEEQLNNYYKRKIALLAAYNPDGIAIETLPSIKEARVAADHFTNEMVNYRAHGKSSYFPDSEYKNGLRAPLPVWISFIARDTNVTNGGDRIEECIDAMNEYDLVTAVGVNCVHPANAPALIEKISKRTSKKVIVYTNTGEVWDAREGHRCWDSQGMKILDGHDALDFKHAGATLIGGCCRVVPQQISQFTQSLNKEHETVKKGGCC